MSTAEQRRTVSEAFSAIVGGRPLFEDSDGPVYGEYRAETDRMYYGTVSNSGLIPCGDVKYRYFESVEKNVERLVDEAKRYSRNGRQV